MDENDTLTPLDNPKPNEALVSSSNTTSTATTVITPLLHPSLASLLLPIYPSLLPLQSHLLPLLLNPHVIHNPRDLSVTAETGSGKTLCFILPIVNSILKGDGGGVGKGE
jgi:superfamily II DNA/RNA helicase